MPIAAESKKWRTPWPEQEDGQALFPTVQSPSTQPPNTQSEETEQARPTEEEAVVFTAHRALNGPIIPDYPALHGPQVLAVDSQVSRFNPAQKEGGVREQLAVLADEETMLMD